MGHGTLLWSRPINAALRAHNADDENPSELVMRFIDASGLDGRV